MGKTHNNYTRSLYEGTHCEIESFVDSTPIITKMSPDERRRTPDPTNPATIPRVRFTPSMSESLTRLRRALAADGLGTFNPGVAKRFRVLFEAEGLTQFGS